MHRIARPTWAALGLLMAGTTLIAALALQRGAPGSVLPHGYCFTWNPALLWTHVISDGLIGLRTFRYHSR